jgi:hypothetical protein|eukprot:CAMPEP_0198304350 /NCGR_PEP_ID=MMETSP1449-20131203/57357_1 /TAXON_ID=420275 /ORGANISM="Attheya septentrionalis, Strain CCMP2084" /LENGTH=160 /DNA_ID=CAMNT_0044006871 /DNA_START=758 /DNA_END=1240 /DNA_ORIENTATION=-
MFWTSAGVRCALRATATGATVTMLSTIASCAIAIKVEGVGHRTLYFFFPRWYDNVKIAYGLEHLDPNSPFYNPKVLTDKETGLTTETTSTLSTTERVFRDTNMTIDEGKTKSDPTTELGFRNSDFNALNSYREEELKLPDRFLRQSENFSQEVFSAAMTG